MFVRNEYPAGVPCWIDLTPPDPAAAVEFYAGLFGWQFINRAPVGAPFEYHVAQLSGLDVAAVGSPTPTSTDPPAWTMYVTVDDAAEALSRVRAAGGQVLEDPQEVPGVGRSAACLDPGGAPFSIWQSLGRNGLQLVNEPGTWNFNELTTTIDADAAEAFYGAVFGWKPVPVDFGLTSSTMFVVPGYGDFLATVDPGLRERHEAQAVPDDFSNAVAWLARAAADARPAWDTTFAVDDTDAVVERAERLGARILEPPHDTGPVRVALIEDPQGARFTASRYTPPAA
jgi:predicted enzyme related to lactoylglutathione lyase